MFDLKTDKTSHILDSIVDFSISFDLSGAVTADGRMYLWGKKAVDFINGHTNESEPVLYKSKTKWKEIRSTSHYALALDESGNVYECDLDTAGNKTFHRIESIRDIESIYNSFGRIAVSKNGNIYYWFGLYESKESNSMIDKPWNIERILNEIKPTDFAFGSIFVVAYNKDGAYFWGENGASKENKGVDMIRTPTLDTELKDFDNLYCGYSVIYLQKGLDIKVIQK